MPSKPFLQDAARIGKMFTIGPNGELPSSKVPTADLAWQIYDQLQRDDVKRSEKRTRVFKQYKRFPPTSYSTMFKDGLPWMSNVCWGQLKFIVDGQKSVFYDMISEAPEIIEIKTRFGKDKDEQMDFSQKISWAFDQILREWPGYLTNSEQDIEQMLLNSAGIEIWETREGWESYNVPVNDFLLPNDTRIDFRNLEVLCVKRDYSPDELYKLAIESPETAKSMGWNREAVIDFIRFNITYDNVYRTREEWTEAVAAGDINLVSFVNEKLRTAQVYVKEFGSNGITKLIVPQTYAVTLTRMQQMFKGVGGMSEKDIAKKTGFLFAKEKFCDIWGDLFVMTTDSVGSGKFHEMQSQAEQAYVAAREYDITMNRIVDAIKINMMLILTGGNPDANKRLREMAWFPMFVLPDNVNPAQVKLDVPTVESLQTLTYIMRDTYSGMSVYKSNQATNGGRQRTKGEAEIDEANQSQVTGTQAKRFNEGRTAWLRQLYKRFVSCSESEVGGEYVRKFKQLLKEQDVPFEAAEWKNIRSVKSVMIAGAGSIAMKLMLGEKLVGYTGMQAMNSGQERAIRNLCAWAGGPGNVDIYRPRQEKPNIPVERQIAYENASMSIQDSNPENYRVYPSDPHYEHFLGHYSDMMYDTSNILQMKDAGAQPEEILSVINRVKIKGGHNMAHLKYLSEDKTKKDIVEQLAKNLGQIQEVIDKVEPEIQKAIEAKQQQGPQVDPELQMQVAKAQLELDTAKKKADINLGSKAAQSELKIRSQEAKAASDIAIDRAKAHSEATKKKAVKKSVQQPPEPSE